MLKRSYLMFFFRRLIALGYISIFFTFSSVSWAMETDEIEITKINSIKDFENKIRFLLDEKKIKPEVICVCFDFHGFIVNETKHKPPLTLKENAKETLQYLKDKNIPFFIATAWDKFNDVIQEGIIKLELADLFDVETEHTAALEDFTLGYRQERYLEGYKNGRVIALKYKTSDNKINVDENADDIYFLQKAYGIQLIYPKKFFEYIVAGDDSKMNLEIFAEDTNYIPHTANADFQELILCHLISEK